MKKNLKRILSLILALVLCFGLAAPAFADGDSQEQTEPTAETVTQEDTSEETEEEPEEVEETVPEETSEEEELPEETEDPAEEESDPEESFEEVTLDDEELEMMAFEETHEGHDVYLKEILLGKQSIRYCGNFHCNTCNVDYEDTITQEALGMPILNIDGDLSKATASKNKIDVGVTYSGSTSFVSNATLKVQGASSVEFPKKNYTLQLLKEDGSKNKVNLGWGKQSKYCLKANWVDASHSRNVVSGQLMNEIIHSRNINDELNGLTNGGVVDGFPIVVYNNGMFHGLYTLNIPKDKWMFGMKDNGHQALLFAENWNNSTALRETMNTSNPADSGWEIEYCSTEDTEEGTAWALESMNSFIKFLTESSPEEFARNVDKYTDVERTIDMMIFLYLSGATDNSAKNIIWATYDGVKWIPSAYDMDSTWGMYWDGSFPTDCGLVYAINGIVDEGAIDNQYFCRLYQRIIELYPDEVVGRYWELRETIVNESHIMGKFNQFVSKIPDLVYKADRKKWTSIPSVSANNTKQISTFVKTNIARMDSNMQNFKGAPVLQPLSTLTEGTHILLLNGKDVGEYTFAKSGSGWTIQDENGYLAVSSARLTSSKTPFVWTFKNNRFSAAVKTGLIFGTPVTYYLSENSGKANVSVLTNRSAATFVDWLRFCRHAGGKGVAENEVAATCKEAGSYDYVVFCTKCGEEMSRQKVTAEKLDHVPGQAVKQNETAASCIVDGGFDMVAYCTVCGEEVSREHEVIAAQGHIPTGEVITVRTEEPSCEKTGAAHDAVLCAVCGEEAESGESYVIPAAGHTAGKSKVETLDGSRYNVVRCTVCNKILSKKAAGEISVNVTVTKKTSRVLIFFTRTTYTVEIVGTSTIPGVNVASVQYSTDNRTWKTGTSFTSSSEPSTIYIRVTDSGKNVTNFVYQNGTVTRK